MDDKTPLISIIIPVYKVEPYLERCLDSVVGQTYRNLEIILVDDGSPDRSGEICDEYAAHDGRIIVIHQENQGVSAARNAGLDIAKGDYILFVDSDDWLEKDACRTVMEKTLARQADLACFRFKLLLPSGEIRICGSDRPGVISRSEMMGVLTRDDYQNSVINKLFAACLFDGIRFLAGRYCEDMEIMYRIAHRASVVYMSDAVLYNYFRHPGTLTGLRYRASSIKGRWQSFAERLSFFQQYYPEHADEQSAQLMREMLLGLEWLKGEPDYPAFLDEYHRFIHRYGPKIKDFKKYNRLIRLYDFCRPAALLYEKGRHFLYRLGCKGVLR